MGKSTQAKLLADWLAGQGRRVLLTFEPGDTHAGAMMRRIVLDPATGDLDPRAEALLYAADKAHHVLRGGARPALRARRTVVMCDRYVDSMLAYQGAGRVLDVDRVEQIARWATADLLPDLTVVLDLDPDAGVHEIVDKDRLESAGADFHVRAREYFLALAARDPEHYLVLGARGAREAIAAAAIRSGWRHCCRPPEWQAVLVSTTTGVWTDLIGQERVIATLRRAVTGERHAMTHAWLFTGPPGSGRSNAARAFAAALQCPEGGCGTCHTCRTVAVGGPPRCHPGPHRAVVDRRRRGP